MAREIGRRGREEERRRRRSKRRRVPARIFGYLTRKVGSSEEGRGGYEASRWRRSRKEMQLADNTQGRNGIRSVFRALSFSFSL